MNAPEFPPLLSGRTTAGADPFAAAVAEARSGCDAGQVLHDLSDGNLHAAVVFAPDVTLGRAAVMLPLCAVAFQNALGALGPSELPVHLDWAGGFVVNGAFCGGLRATASTSDLDVVPDWLVIGISVPFVDDGAGGDAPDRTTLYAEGCGGLMPGALLESWARHMLTWLHRWEEDGEAPLHREWSGLAYGLGQERRMGDETGTFLGLDETLGMLFKSGGKTRLIPLVTLLQETP